MLQRVLADKVLVAFKEHPEAWTRVDTILESSPNPNTKYIALQVSDNECGPHYQRYIALQVRCLVGQALYWVLLGALTCKCFTHLDPLCACRSLAQILEGLIKYRWKTLPAEQREGIRTYLVQKIITVRDVVSQRLIPQTLF